jgi:putative ABC transport system permease protein
MGDRVKYPGIIFGIAFATLLMAQQIAIFVGIMERTASQISDIRDAEIWVMDANTRYVDEAPALPDSDLWRVRSVPGVAWAVKLYKGQVQARLDNGQYRTCNLLGIDDNSLVGAPRQMILGQVEDLKLPDAVIVDAAGYDYIWPGQPLQLGGAFEMNDRRAVVVGICKVAPPYYSLPVLFTRYSQAERFVPHDRNLMTFILAKPESALPVEEVCRRIDEQTRLEHRRLAALTQDQFRRQTIRYFLSHTGIAVNFGITIALGFIVGAAIAGQTFYLFTVENLKQFGALKAMGACNGHLLCMISLQALVVGGIGYGVGCGLTAGFFEATQHSHHLAGLCLGPEIMLGVGVAVLLIVLLASVLSARRVLLLEPAEVFRG